MPINKLKNFSQMLVEFYIFVPSVTNSDIAYVIQNRGFYSTNYAFKHFKMRLITSLMRIIQQ